MGLRFICARQARELVRSEYSSPELAAETIEKIRVRGAFRAPEAVKQALADRVE